MWLSSINAHFKNLHELFLLIFVAMKIQISSSTRELLETFSTFVIEERGLIDIKVF